MSSSHKLRTWAFAGYREELGNSPLLMGIVNATPDSFSDGGRFLATDAAVDHALKLVEEGADLLDIGGESTRPGADLVTADEEIRRVIPVIERLASKTSVPISIDTTKSTVARHALEAGARIVNDISGLRFDDEMARICRQFSCGIICMHMQGTPRTMQAEPHYADVVSEICEFFRDRLQTLTESGIPRESIVLDPGVGFGKTAQHNVQILSHVDQFQLLDRPVLIGHSRKRFLQKVIGRSVDERLFGTIGVSVALASQGADIIRVHDVAANRDAIMAFLATSGATG